MTTSVKELEALAVLRQACVTGQALEARERAGISLAEAARAAGVSAPTLSRWETGRRLPGGAAALRYAGVLNTLQWLVAA